MASYNKPAWRCCLPASLSCLQWYTQLYSQSYLRPTLYLPQVESSIQYAGVAPRAASRLLKIATSIASFVCVESYSDFETSQVDKTARSICPDWKQSHVAVCMLWSPLRVAWDYNPLDRVHERWPSSRTCTWAMVYTALRQNGRRTTKV